MVFDPTELAAIRAKSPDFKEPFDIGSPASPSVENIWIPDEDLPGFKDYCMQFFEICKAFEMNKLLPALAIGLGLERDFFAEYHSLGDNQLRLLHYPEAEAEVFESGKKGRIGAHTVSRQASCFKSLSVT